MYQWKGSVTYFMHPVDHVLLSRLMIREINTLKTSFAIYALYYLHYKKKLVSISKNGEPEKSIKIICILINKALPHNYF